MAVAEAGGMREMLAQVYRWQGEAYLLEMRYDEAEAALRQASRLAEKIKHFRLRWDICATLERLYLAQGREAEADEKTACMRRIEALVAAGSNNLYLTAAFRLDQPQP